MLSPSVWMLRSGVEGCSRCGRGAGWTGRGEQHKLWEQHCLDGCGFLVRTMGHATKYLPDYK